MQTFELSDNDIEAVNGGFICGGLCVGAAFLAGALIGGGATAWALS